MEDKKDDDEISIDFSKITKIFKKKEEKPEAKVEDVSSQDSNKAEEKDDDEINIDFSKIKNVFSKVKKAISEDDEKETQEHTKEEKPAEKPDVPKEEPKKQTWESVEKKQLSESKKETKPSEEKDDDEINIDFSKIKKMFKSDDSGKKSSEKDDDEINIDFSKLKNIKNIFKKSDKPSQTEDDISLDFKKISNFFIAHKTILLLLIPIILCIFLRVQSAYLPATDDWAANSVINNLRSQISSQISSQYPNLPAQNKDALVENELQKVLKEQKAQIDQQIQGTSNFFKSKLQDDTGQTYLLAIDPFFWMRHAKNVAENGHPGDELRNGEPWDNHMYAPGGRGIPSDFFNAYFEGYLYKFLSFFNSNIGIMKVVFYVPVLISALSIIPAFFITRKLVGNFGGLIAATILAIHPSFLTRTAGGFADTDAYNVMFPLFIAWLFLEALDAKSTKNNIIFSALSGFLVGLYSFTWGGWWYILDFILVAAISYIAYYSFVHKKELMRSLSGFAKQKAIKNSLMFLFIFLLVSAISASYFVDFTHFTKFAKNPIGFAKLKEVGITTIWPNVFTTVAEQNSASLNNVVNQVGLGKFFFFLIALMGITLTLERKHNRKIWFIAGSFAWYIAIFLFKVQNLNKFLILISIPIIIRIIIALWESDTEIDIKYAIFLSLWFIATTFASTKGVRFTLLLVPAFSIGFGIAIGEFYRYANVWITKLLQINKIISKTTVIVLILLLLVAPYKSAASTAKNEIPSFNDAWAISLEKIKADSQPDAIINSWWDFGHWFKYWADRAVTFDGTSQNTPQAHWIGKALLTSDEEEAIGILRMLDCSGITGGVQSFNELNALIKDQVTTIELLYDIIPKNKKEAKKVLDKHLDEKETEKILKLTHCQPPENYFITSEDMIGKSGVWAHFGSWDFNRALIYNTLKKKEYADDIEKSASFLQERFGYSKSEAENLYYEVQSITDSSQANNWIAPWPGYAGTIGCNKDEMILRCDNGFIVNLTTNDAYADSPQGRMHPKKLSIPTNKGVIIKEYNESVFNLQNGRNLGLTLIKNGESYQMLQLDSDLTGSMFTRMFYQEGIGLRYFKKFSDERSVFGGRIIVWKVDWEGKEKNIIEEPKPEVIEEENMVDDKIEIKNTTKEAVEEKNIDDNNSQPLEEEKVNENLDSNNKSDNNS